MARVLFGWEFGGGLGHLTTLLPIAEGLAGDHEAVFAVKHLGDSQRFLTGRGGPVADSMLLQAPRWPTVYQPKDPRALAHSHADTLRNHGYHDPALLLGQARGWQAIIRLVEPSLVVADYSPTLLMAARGQVPTLAVGTGYSIPPPGQPCPPMRPWETEVPASSRTAEREVLQAVQSVQKQLGVRPVDHLADIFNGDATFACTIPEFDPYRAFRREPPLAPYNVPAFGAVRPLETRPENRVFVYLPANNRHLATTLDAIVRLKLPGDVFVPGIDAGLRRRFESSSLTFHDRPLPLEQVLPESRIAIHHGGHATAFAALRAGTPQLLLVNNLERLVTSYGLHQLNCAITVNADGKLTVESVMGYLRRLLDTAETRNAATATAERLAAQPPSDPVGTILDTCRDLIGKV